VPAFARFGLVLLACGLLADVAFHASGGDGYPAHVVIFLAMLCVIAGVVQMGLRSGNSHSRKGTVRSLQNANR
jgi:hypothetical protein